MSYIHPQLYVIVTITDRNGIRTHNHLVLKRTLNHLTKLALASSKEFLNIQITIESRFTLKFVRDMIITYSDYYSFEHISEFLTFPIDTTDTVMKGWYLMVLYFPFNGFHFTTTLRVLKPVSYVFIWHHLICGAKGVRDVEPTCRCYQSNIMPDSIFRVNIAQCVTCG